MASTTAAKTGGLTVTVNSNRKSIAETFIDVARMLLNRFGKPSYFDLFTKDERPELISDWLKWLHEGQRAMEQRQQGAGREVSSPGGHLNASGPPR